MPERPFTAPRGTRDILPPLSWAWEEVVRRAFDTFALAGYAPLETPVFEHTEVFERGVGEGTEVVNKEMYTFTDRGDRSLTLRPEMTASVMRAVLENGLDRGPLPVKFICAGPLFRYERPQKGRYRQFSQINVEVLGSPSPLVDAEVIGLGADFLRDCGVEYELLINSIGHVAQECRLGYVEELRTFLEAHREELDAEDRDRATTNPLRVFDSKSARTAEVLGDAPLIGDHLCAACSQHFATVRELLGDLGVEHRLEPRLVRGLDYYTHTAFEFTSAALGAQSTVLGGGRYDGLAETLGGPPFPGMGFAIGIDRLLLAATAGWPAGAPIAIYVVAITDAARRVALRVVFELRRAGIGSDLDLTGRGLKGQMKAADRSGARWAVIVGEDELVSDKAQLKDLGSGDQELIGVDEIVERVR